MNKISLCVCISAFILLNFGFNCNNNTPIIKHKIDRNDSIIGFNNQRHTHFSIDTLKQWNIEESGKIKEILFSHFDTIPEGFKQFQNVEKIVVSDMFGSSYLPNIFPKLKEIEVDIVELAIDKNAEFKKNLEKLTGGKSHIIGIKSFLETPKLKHVELGFSQFDTFPRDFESLENVEVFIIGAYMGHLDLSNLDVSKLKKIRKLEFNTWNEETITGFPKNVRAMNPNTQFVINHPSMTNEQKKQMKRFKKINYND